MPLPVHFVPAGHGASLGARQQVAEEDAGWSARKSELSDGYAQSKAIYDRLKGEVTLLEENLEDMSFGLYKPHYDFDSSDAYKAALQGVWDLKKAALRDGTAAVCPVKWNVHGSNRDGARMVKGQIKLMLRAFNGECDAAIAKVSWNNVARMEERIL